MAPAHLLGLGEGTERRQDDQALEHGVAHESHPALCPTLLHSVLAHVQGDRHTLTWGLLTSPAGHLDPGDDWWNKTQDHRKMGNKGQDKLAGKREVRE